MASITTAYGTANQTITITLASLADGAGRESLKIQNSSGFTDVWVQFAIKTASSGVDTSGGCIEIYAYGSVDGGTTFSDGCTGADAAHTVVNLPLLWRFKANANATTFTSPLINIKHTFGGVPQYFGFVVQNESGAALDSTEGNHAKIYQGGYGSVA